MRSPKVIPSPPPAPPPPPPPLVATLLLLLLLLKAPLLLLKLLLLPLLLVCLTLTASAFTVTFLGCARALLAKHSRLMGPKYPVLGRPFLTCQSAIFCTVSSPYTPVHRTPSASCSMPTSVPASPSPRSRVGTHTTVVTSGTAGCGGARGAAAAAGAAAAVAA